MRTSVVSGAVSEVPLRRMEEDVCELQTARVWFLEVSEGSSRICSLCLQGQCGWRHRCALSVRTQPGTVAFQQPVCR